MSSKYAKNGKSYNHTLEADGLQLRGGAVVGGDVVVNGVITGTQRLGVENPSGIPAPLVNLDYNAPAVKEFVGGYYFSNATLTANRAIGTPTAAALVAGGLDIGDSFITIVNNTQAGAFLRTMTAAAGVTVQGTAAVAQNTIGVFRTVIENATSGSEAATTIRID